MSVALQRVDGVASVKVTLKDGRASLTLKPGNTVTLAALRRVIERNGFTPQGATVVAEAEVTLDPAGQSRIAVTGANEAFGVSTATSAGVRDELKKRTGRTIVVHGVVGAAKTNQSGAMDVTNVKPAGK